jgi:hypothetical protein
MYIGFIYDKKINISNFIIFCILFSFNVLCVGPYVLKKALDMNSSKIVFMKYFKSNSVMSWVYFKLIKKNSPKHQITTRNSKNNILHGVRLLILISGVIGENPGPIKFPGGSCAKPVKSHF